MVCVVLIDKFQKHSMYRNSTFMEALNGMDITTHLTSETTRPHDLSQKRVFAPPSK